LNFAVISHIIKLESRGYRVTDRQTYEDGIYRASIASRGNNSYWHQLHSKIHCLLTGHITLSDIA